MATSETMKIIIQIQDEAKAALAKLAKELEGLDKQSKKSSRAIDVFREGISKLKNALSQVRQSVFTLKNAVIGAVAAFGLFKVYSFIKNATLLAARYTTLGVTLNVLGKQAGYSVEQLKEFEIALAKTGIAAIQTRSILTRMIQSQLDLTKATELGRVAQNAAVIAGLNSSETFSRMIHAIQANSVEILRTIGMNVSFEKSYKILARTLDTSVGSLTEAQKTQARFNAVLAGGRQIAGAYESAMDTAGKKLLSFARYMQNFRVAVGQAFEPTLAIIVDSMTQSVKEFTELIKDPAFQKSLQDFAILIGDEIQKAFQWLIDNKEAILNVIVEITKSLGDALLSLNRVVELLFGSQKRLIEQQRQNFGRIAGDLAKFVAERDKLQNKLKEWEELEKSSEAGVFELLAKDFDFGKTERKIKELDVLIKKYQELSNDLRSDIKEKEVEEPSKPITDTFLIQARDRAVIEAKALAAAPKDPLGSSLMASNFKRAVADVKREMVVLKSSYDRNLVSMEHYYNELERLAKDSFEKELEYLEKKAEKQPDPDKRLKIEDQIYNVIKEYRNKETALTEQRREAVKKYAEERLQIEKTLQSAKFEVLQKSDLARPEEKNKLELDQLKITQAERLKSLVEGKATEKQLRENKTINILEEQALTEEQERRHVERILEIRRTLEDVRQDIVLQSSTTSQAQLDKIELEQLKRTQEDRLKELKEANASRDELKENEILSERERQVVVENQQKSSSQKTLEIQRTLEEARLALIDPNNLKAVFDAEKTQLEQHQADRLQSIKDAKLDELDEVAAIEDAGRLSQLEKDKQHADQRIKIQELYTESVKGVLGNLNSLFGDMYEASGRETKAFFNLQKGVAIAQATIATYESAVQAFKSFSGLGPYGIALGYAASAVAVASGLAKVAVIRSQSYAEGGVVKGYSPSPKADNIQANVTAGEFIHPVDVVKYYGLKGMEIIRQKLIPPEVLYQISTFKEKKESIKESLQKNLERTNDFVKDYSKKILGISKSQSDKSSGSSLISKSKMTSVIDKSSSIIDKSISTSATDRSVSDHEEVIVSKLFERLISDKSSGVDSKESHTKELIRDVRTDKERTSRDRIVTDRIDRTRDQSSQFISDKDRESTKHTDRISTSDKSSERYEVDSKDVARSKEFVSDRSHSALSELMTKSIERIKDYYKDSESSSDSLVVKKKTKKKKYKYYATDEKQDYQSRIHVGESISDRESFLNTVVKESIAKDRMQSVIREAMQSTTADKSIFVKDILTTSDKSIYKKDTKSTADKSVLDKVIDRSISDKLVSDKLVEKSSISQSLIDKVVDQLLVDKSRSVINSSITSKLVGESSTSQFVDKSQYEKLVSKSNDLQLDKSFVSNAISKILNERIVERSRLSDRVIGSDKSIITDKSTIDKSVLLQTLSDKITTLDITTSDKSTLVQMLSDKVSTLDKVSVSVLDKSMLELDWLNTKDKLVSDKSVILQSVSEKLGQIITSDKLLSDKVLVSDKIATASARFQTDKFSTFDKSFASNIVTNAIDKKFIKKLRVSDKSVTTDIDKSAFDKLDKLITAEKISTSDKLITAKKDESVIKEKLELSVDKSIIDKSINQSISDRLVSENLVDKSVVSESLIDKVVSRLAIDSSHTSDKLINTSYIKEIIDRSSSDEALHSLKSEVGRTYIDKAISKLIEERIVERTLIQNADSQRDKLILSSDSYYKLDSRNVDFMKSLLQSTAKITEIDKSRESIKEVIAESNVKDLRESVYKSKDKTIIDKSISFVKNIAKTVQKIIPTINPQPVMVMSPIVIKEAISNTESFTKLKSKQLKNMNIASSFIKMVESRTSQTIQQLASGGRVKGTSPHSKADNISINATAGEFMHPVDVVKYYSNKGMEAIRQKIIPREVIAHYANNIQIPKPNYSHAFALGGEIPKTRETSDSAVDNASEKQINITNLIDPAVFGQYLASSTGEQQFVNVISANKFTIKGILGS